MSYMVSGKDRKLTAEWLDEIVKVPEWIDEDIEDKIMDIAFAHDVNWKTLWVRVRTPVIVEYRKAVFRWMYSQPKYRSTQVIAEHLGIPHSTVDRLIGFPRPHVDPAHRVKPAGVPAWVMKIVKQEAATYKVSIHDIWGDTYDADVRACRYEIYKKVYKTMKHPSFSMVGRWFQRDHSTIMEAVKGVRRGKENLEDIHSVRGSDSGGGSDQHRQDAA